MIVKNLMKLAGRAWQSTNIYKNTLKNKKMPMGVSKSGSLVENGFQVRPPQKRMEYFSK